MVLVLGQHDCFVLRERCRSADVNAFAPEYATLKKVPIVDGVILYECLFYGKQWILVQPDC
jgi:hypothetical protein